MIVKDKFQREIVDIVWTFLAMSIRWTDHLFLMKRMNLEGSEIMGPDLLRE